MSYVEHHHAVVHQLQRCSLTCLSRGLCWVLPVHVHHKRCDMIGPSVELRSCGFCVFQDHVRVLVSIQAAPWVCWPPQRVTSWYRSGLWDWSTRSPDNRPRRKHVVEDLVDACGWQLGGALGKEKVVDTKIAGLAGMPNLNEH